MQARKILGHVRNRDTAVFSGRVRRTPTDARALLTQEIQKIPKIHWSSVDAVVDTGIGSEGMSDTSLAHMSSSPDRWAYFSGLDAPAHPRLSERRVREMRPSYLSLLPICTL